MLLNLSPVATPSPFKIKDVYNWGLIIYTPEYTLLIYTPEYTYTPESAERRA